MRTTAATERRRSSVAATRRTLSGDAAALRDARRLVAEAVGPRGPALRDNAVLLAGELVTNALVHGGGWFLLAVDVDATRVRIEVTDANWAPPRLLPADGTREHGRGLAIVDALATRWGAEHLGTHKIVWFELSTPGPA